MMYEDLMSEDDLNDFHFNSWLNEFLENTEAETDEVSMIDLTSEA